MFKSALLVVCLLAGVGPVRSSLWTVDPCDACASIGNWYVGGCSGLVARLLGRAQKWTGHYEQGREISSTSLDRGDVVGWKPQRGQAYGHVAVYVGYGCCNCKYVEAQLIPARGGGWSRCRNNDFGRTLFHMGY